MVTLTPFQELLQTNIGCGRVPEGVPHSVLLNNNAGPISVHNFIKLKRTNKNGQEVGVRKKKEKICTEQTSEMCPV